MNARSQARPPLPLYLTAIAMDGRPCGNGWDEKFQESALGKTNAPVLETACD
ncbi:MAG: hypothetical protein PHD58_11175 [Anaerolineales bacterium]|nr:hypothetical protein [Anaerolineales bacterium]